MFRYIFNDEPNRLYSAEGFHHVFWINGAGFTQEMVYTMAEAKAWVFEQFGPDTFKATSMSIRFKDPDHAFAFKMRWC